MTEPTPERDGALDELIRRAQAGDEDAFQSLHARTTPSLCVWARLRTGARLAGRIDPDDVVQETWARALVKLPDYELTGSFHGWLCAIAKRVLLEARRHADRLAASPTADRDPSWRPLSQLSDALTRASQRIARDERVKSLVDRIIALDRLDREIFIGCGLEHRTAADVAQVLGENPYTVRKRWQRQRERLREQWGFLVGA